MPWCEKVEIACPGIFELHLKGRSGAGIPPGHPEKGENYGKPAAEKGKRSRREYVSANPTGPLQG